MTHPKGELNSCSPVQTHPKGECKLGVNAQTHPKGEWEVATAFYGLESALNVNDFYKYSFYL